ncbi:YbaB/EbfC family nucleoid-associated protein [Saccharomonospora sp. CUA-673]|uniref:YbaB/EbfC family nucleoid-associated protein n=1 Tax=Saccharomonospora sp. CUA-673 TaxID=1904969 RepID=UPI00096AA80C|nr:YbaB/EbfC family nucleoid-associated protein [Saccharomonospora sp. CUA-673]
MTAPDSMPDPTKLADNLKTWAQGLEQKAARYGELQSRLDATSVTRTSSDGAVRVTVDAKGVPTELTITDRGRGADPQALSAVLMSTMRQAQAELRDRVATLTTETVGDDGPGNDVVAGYRDQFPDPEPAFGGSPTRRPTTSARSRTRLPSTARNRRTRTRVRVPDRPATRVGAAATAPTAPTAPTMTTTASADRSCGDRSGRPLGKGSRWHRRVTRSSPSTPISCARMRARSVGRPSRWARRRKRPRTWPIWATPTASSASRWACP